MSPIVAPEDVDALRTPASGDARPYDFRRPDRIARDQIQTLRRMHDRFAQLASTALADYLHGAIELTTMGIDQCSFGEWQAGLPAPTVLYALAMPPFDDLAALEVSPAVAFAWLDRVMGGAGQTIPPSRPLTELELNAVDGVVRVLLHTLTETWKSAVDLSFGIRSRETQPTALTIAAPSDFAVVVGMNVQIGDTNGALSLALPAGIVDKAAAQLGQARRRPPAATTQTERAWLQENLGRIPLPVDSHIETHLAARDILALAPGDVVSLGVPLAEPLEVSVAGLRKLSARLVVRERKAMLQIVGSPSSRPAAGDVR